MTVGIGMAIVSATHYNFRCFAVDTQGAESLDFQPAGGDSRTPEICIGIQSGDVAIEDLLSTPKNTMMRNAVCLSALRIIDINYLKNSPA